MHGWLPGVGLYDPASQPVQGPPFGPVKPALHRQAVKALLLTEAVFELSGQVVHALAPWKDVYVPIGQF